MTRMAGLAYLRGDDAAMAVADHPELREEGVQTPVVVLAAAATQREADELTDMIALLRTALRRNGDSAWTVLRALFPEERLTVGPGVLAQIRRNAQAQQELAEEFGLLSSTQIAELAGSRAANPAALAHGWRKRGQIFTVDVDRVQRYPGFQFGPDGGPRPIIKEVIETLGDAVSPWELALWFTSSNGWLGGVRPVDVLDGNAEDLAALRGAADRLAAELAE
jgi:hypothetical protein